MIIASSSSGLTMSEIQSGAASHPERCVIAHPFNPPHLIPLVEIVGGAKTSEETIQRAIGVLYVDRARGPSASTRKCRAMSPTACRRALAREVYYLVAEGVLSAADVDTRLCWGPGLRWGIMGNMMLNHLGGGPGGIEHFFHQFAGPMTASWKTLGSPELTPEMQKSSPTASMPRWDRARSGSSRPRGTSFCSAYSNCARSVRRRSHPTRSHWVASASAIRKTPKTYSALRRFDDNNRDPEELLLSFLPKLSRAASTIGGNHARHTSRDGNHR